MKRLCGILIVLIAVFALISCGGGGGGGGGGGSAPATSNSLTGCWWVYTETTSNGDIAKYEINFDNSRLTSILYVNAEKLAELYVPYTLTGNTISLSTNDVVVVYAKNGYSRGNVNSWTFDYSVSGNSLTMSNGKADGVLSNQAFFGNTSAAWTRK